MGSNNILVYLQNRDIFYILIHNIQSFLFFFDVGIAISCSLHELCFKLNWYDLQSGLNLHISEQVSMSFIVKASPIDLLGPTLMKPSFLKNPSLQSKDIYDVISKFVNSS